MTRTSAQEATRGVKIESLRIEDNRRDAIGRTSRTHHRFQESIVFLRLIVDVDRNLKMI